MYRGSTWHIWDLHLHTPYSVLNNQFGNPQNDSTWDHYIDAIEKKAAITGVKAIGITDYFTIEGYKRVREYQQKGRLQNLLILPNIEFRIGTIINGKRLNYHVLFSPDTPINYIEESFLHDLSFVHEEEPFQRTNHSKLKLANLEEFGETLRQQHAKFREQTSLAIGCLTAVVSLDEIKERLSENGRFSGKYLLVLAEENLNLANWDGQDHATRKQLIQMSHAIFSSNRKTRDFYLGKMHDTETQYLSEFKSFKPCLWGCDSHGLEERFLEPDQNRYCWIKGEVSWEGLRQVLFEPEHRVSIQPNNPEPTKSFYTLDSVNVGSTQFNRALSIDKVDIDLNPNLVAIIGGRGSGKTALLDLIASCFPEGKKLRTLNNSFCYRLYNSGRRSGENATPVSMSIRFRSGDLFSTEIGSQSQVYEKADVLYLTQNHMDDYTVNPDKLYAHIIDLVFGKNLDRRNGYNELEMQTQGLEHRIQALNLEIEQLREQVNQQLSEEQTELIQKRGELSDYESRLLEHETLQSDVNQEAEQLTDRLQQLKMRRNQISELRDNLNNTIFEVEQFHTKYQRAAQDINSRLTKLTDSLNLSLIPLELTQINSVLAHLSSNIESVESDHAPNTRQIVEIEQSLNELQGIDRTIAQLRRAIHDINSEIKAIEFRIQILQEKEQRIVTLDQSRTEHYAELMKKMIETRAYLQETIDQFETGQYDLLAGISFSALVDTNISRGYMDRIVDKVDGRTNSSEAISHSLNSIIENAHELLNPRAREQDSYNMDAILLLVTKLNNWARDIRLKRNTKESEFFNAVFSPFFSIGLHIEFNTRPLEALSMGERAVVLLKILLGLDDTPLLIDQPEEHLDNRYIFDELTPAFRSAKTRRQIIIATHNANLVVNTDAEQIIVAEHNDGVLSYKVGTLEDLDVRESIKTILEGGDKAFKKREEKYGYLF